ncbi:MAG: methyltransferase domain-containing protein [Methylococcaceae bacterium]|jgi:SAM-dependent methyltransferase
MGHRECFQFGELSLSQTDVLDKNILEIGSHEDGGSLRSYVTAMKPNKYWGIDLQEGPGVDEICNAYHLLDRFGPHSFDVLIAIELLEHIRDWRKMIHIFKQILRPGGLAIITTRSAGFPFHYAPFDFWRFEQEDMLAIFSDFDIIRLENDTRAINGKVTPGVFITVRKPANFIENNLNAINLYSILTKQRLNSVRDWDIYLYEIQHLGLPYFKRFNGIPYLLREYLASTLSKKQKANLKKIFRVN